jgi:hypothetical protein
MNKKLTLAIITSTIALFGLYHSNVLAMATLPDGFASAASEQIRAGAATSNPDGPGVEVAIQAVVNILSLTVGVASTIMIIYGAFKFIASAGEANSIATAKRIILYSLIGLALALTSQAILAIVTGKLSGL